MDLSPFQMLWIGAATIVAVGWLVVSFSEPSPRRASIEWIAASAMFVGLLGLFVYLALRAWESDNTFALVAFGFLCVFFGGGALVSLWHTITSFGSSGRKSHGSATN